MLKLAPLVLRNVLRNRRRSLLTLASTVVSFSLLTLLVAIYQAFFFGKDASPSEARRLVTRHKVSLTQPLPTAYRQVIKRKSGVVELSPWTWFQGKWVDDNRFFPRFAVDPEKAFVIHEDWKIPAEQLEAFQKKRTACVVEKRIADRWDIKVGQRIQIVGDIFPVTLELDVAGIFKSPSASSCLVFHDEYLSELIPKEHTWRDKAGTYLILADAPGSLEAITRDIDGEFANAPEPTRTESEKEFTRGFLAFLGNVQVFLSAICGAVTFTILLVTANTVAMSVRERTREIAILRTLGYTPGEILQVVIGEAVLISLLGGAIALGPGFLLSVVAETFAAQMGLRKLEWEGALIVIGVAVLVGVIAALVPAVSASRKNLVESMRFAG